MTITQADRDAVEAFHSASFTAIFNDGGDKQTVGGNMNKAHTLLLEAFTAHREAAEARAHEAQPTDEDLADEIAEAISDTLDMDWQPSWAVPNIRAIINRERRIAREEGAKAMQERVLELRCYRADGTRQSFVHAEEITALDPAQIVKDT